MNSLRNEGNGFRRVNDEVFYTDDPLTRITANDIAFLKSEAAKTPRRRARVCAHPDVEDRLHEMLIVHAVGNYVQPHKHIGKSESFHIIEGRLRVILFDDEGTKTGDVEMGDLSSGRAFYYRLSEDRFHTVVPETDWVVFHEVTNGPFERSETVFATWAPGDGKDNSDQQRAFLASIS